MNSKNKYELNEVFILIFPLAFSFIMSFIVPNNEVYSQSDSDFEKEDAIQICCSWGQKLEDGILTFSITNEEGKEKAIINSIKTWDKKIDKIDFSKVKENGDVEIYFENDRGQIAGRTTNYFDDYGHITKSIISLSKEYYGHKFSEKEIGHIVQHEIGHALGLGHANFDGNLMTDQIDNGAGEISDCEVEAVEIANAWKLKDNDDNRHTQSTNFVEC